jgi:hypothetical protein
MPSSEPDSPIPQPRNIIPFRAPVEDGPGQPRPIWTSVGNCQGVSAISRLWATGDPPRCGLCPREECSVNPGGVCLVLTNTLVTLKEGPLFRLPPAPGRRADDAAG